MDIEKVVILKMLYEGNPSIPEMSEGVDKAYATVHKHLRELVDKELVSPPRTKGAARDYHITDKGYEYLKANGLLEQT
ncbi:MAG: winged helix-turn-helix domain-containing protein [Kosmotogaceae bacterium]